MKYCIISQWQIQDFPEGAPTPKLGVLTYFFAENCMKMKELGTGGGVGGVPGALLDLPLLAGNLANFHLLKFSWADVSSFLLSFSSVVDKISIMYIVL